MKQKIPPRIYTGIVALDDYKLVKVRRNGVHWTGEKPDKKQVLIYGQKVRFRISDPAKLRISIVEICNN